MNRQKKLLICQLKRISGVLLSSGVLALEPTFSGKAVAIGSLQANPQSNIPVVNVQQDESVKSLSGTVELDQLSIEDSSRTVVQSIQVPNTLPSATPDWPLPFVPKPGDGLEILPGGVIEGDSSDPDKSFFISSFRTRAKTTTGGSQSYNKEIYKAVAEKIAIVVKDGKIDKIIACTRQRRFEDECKNPQYTLANVNAIFVLKEPPFEFTFSQLFQITRGISEVYSEMGYSTSGATISIDEAGNVVTIEVVEGYLNPENINIAVSPATPSTGLRSEYISKQIETRLTKPLNIVKLQEALQLLNLDPLVGRVNARLSTGTKPGESILDVEIQEAKFSRVSLDFNNSRSPLIGEFERRATLRMPNLLGLGDQGTISYANTEGSNAVDISYTIPLSPQLDTLKIAYGQGNSEIIEEPFRDINRDGQGGDIRSSTRALDITWRHPLSRRILQDESNSPSFEEFAIGVTGSWRESNSTLLGIPFPLSVGADSSGTTTVTALRPFLEYSLRRADRGAFAVRSQFNFGLGALGSNVYNNGEPDSRFTSWQVQVLFRLQTILDTEATMRFNSQLSLQPLVSSEQFSVGGYYNVRGFRRDTKQTDNGFSYSIDVPFTVARLPNNSNIVQLIPFFDAGIGWNATGDQFPAKGLVAAGLGLQWKKGDDLVMRIDYGIPISGSSSDNSTYQGKGLYFTIQWNSF
jgi:hemolysin activation/secretion protein